MQGRLADLYKGGLGVEHYLQKLLERGGVIGGTSAGGGDHVEDHDPSRHKPRCSA